MGYPFGKFAFSVELLGLAHGVGTGKQLFYQSLHLIQTSRAIFLNRLFQSFDAEFDIVEIRNSLPQGTFRDIRKLRLEIAESYTGQFGQSRCHGLVCDRTWNEYRHTPITVVIRVVVVERAIPGRNQTQHLAFDIIRSGRNELLPDVVGYQLDIVLQ